MIQVRTILDVADNSGARKLSCIGVLGGSRKRHARVGDVITASVKEAMPNTPIKKGISFSRTAAAPPSFSTVNRIAHAAIRLPHTCATPQSR